MQNRTYLVLLRPIFGEKLKIAPPHRKTAPLKRSNFGQKISLKIGEDLFFLEIIWIWAEKTFEFPILAEKSVSKSVKTFFFFFFWRSPEFGRIGISDFGPKISLKIGEDLFFFGDHLNLGGKNVWISEISEICCLDYRRNRVTLIQGQWKFGSRSFALFSLFQNSPPLFQILATRLLEVSKNCQVTWLESSTFWKKVILILL